MMSADRRQSVEEELDCVSKQIAETTQHIYGCADTLGMEDEEAVALRSLLADLKFRERSLLGQIENRH